MPEADPLEAVREIFHEEGRDLLERLEKNLLRLEVTEADGRHELLRDTLRIAHTLKGAAGSLEYGGAAGIVHRVETVLQRPERLAESRDAFDVLHQAVDALRANLEVGGTSEEAARVMERLGALASGKPASPETSPAMGQPADAAPCEPRGRSASAGPASAGDPEPEAVRVSLQAIRELMSLSGEVAIRSRGAKERVDEVRSQVQRIGTVLRSVAPEGGARPADEFHQLAGLQRGLLLALDHLEFDALHDTLQSDALDAAVRSLRLRPLSEAFRPLPRLARDLGRLLGKELILTQEGDAIGIERNLLEPLRESLAHLVRNAVDHGLETPAQRLEVGKPRSGRLHLAARLHGSVLSIELSDDGRGLDLERVKQKAVAAGLVDAAAAARLSEAAAADLIFHPGLSTREEVSEISGRGVGLDSVRATLENCGGTVRVRTVRGKGTTFTLGLPVLSHRSHTLILRVGDERVAIPSSAVQRVTRVDQPALSQCDGQPSLEIGGVTVPVLELGVLLGDLASPGATPKDASLVVLRSQDRLAAFVVDELLLDEEVLVRDLEPPLRCPRLLAGVAVRKGGELIGILSPLELLRAAGQRATFAPGAPAARSMARVRRLLVVDDSFTIRTLQKSVLEMAGYQVLVASDGEQALALLAREPVDGILSDVSMPKCDGFQLLSAVRQSPGLRGLPFVLVTSRSSETDRMRGLELGASAYVVKGEFEQDTLLQIVANHVG